MYLVYELLILNGLIVCFFVFAHLRARRRRNDTEAFRARASDRDACIACSVLYSSERRFLNWWKVFPWEAHGILCLRDNTLLLIGRSTMGMQVEKVVGEVGCDVHWVGRKFRTGATSWFSVKTGRDVHYFSAEPGTLIFGSVFAAKKTREIFDEVSAFVCRSNAANQ